MKSGPWRFLLYLVLPQPTKMALLPRELRGELDRINLASNVAMYSGLGATEYEEIHRYGDAEHHEYPAQQLIEERWACRYGRALELGAGSGYFTRLIARHAESVIAVEPVPDIQRVLREKCERHGVSNVMVLPAPATELTKHLAPGSVDSAFVIQSLHHLHGRREIFEALGRVVRPGGRLFIVEPHHNLRRVARLVRKWIKYYRARDFWSREEAWATHDFLTRQELHRLCRHGSFDPSRITGHWIPYVGRLVPEPKARLRLESWLGRLPGLRHMAGVLAVEARRSDAAPR